MRTAAVRSDDAPNLSNAYMQLPREARRNHLAKIAKSLQIELESEKRALALTLAIKRGDDFAFPYTH